MHTYSAPGGTRIFYNSDASGTAIISYDGREMEVPGGDVVPLVLIARNIADRRVELRTYRREEHYGMVYYCHFCLGGGDSPDDIDHDDACLWLMARRLREGAPG